MDSFIFAPYILAERIRILISMGQHQRAEERLEALGPRQDQPAHVLVAWAELQVARLLGIERLDGLANHFHFAVGTFANYDVELRAFGVLVGIVVTKMRSAAFFAFDGRACDDLGDGQEIVKIECSVPAGVVFAVPVGCSVLTARL